jgi:hypothetical protein
VRTIFVRFRCSHCCLDLGELHLKFSPARQASKQGDPALPLPDGAKRRRFAYGQARKQGVPALPLPDEAKRRRFAYGQARKQGVPALPLPDGAKRGRFAYRRPLGEGGRERGGLVHQNDAIARLACAQVLQRFIDLRHRECLSDRCDGMPCAKLQHVIDCRGTSTG